jgi:hypothetical protein
VRKDDKVISVEPPEAMLSELIVLAAIEQGTREVDLGIVTIEALGDWIKKKRAEHGRTPHPEDWDWTTDR